MVYSGIVRRLRREVYKDNIGLYFKMQAVSVHLLGSHQEGLIILMEPPDIRAILEVQASRRGDGKILGDNSYRIDFYCNIFSNRCDKECCLNETEG